MPAIYQASMTATTITAGTNDVLWPADDTWGIWSSHWQHAIWRTEASSSSITATYCIDAAADANTWTKTWRIWIRKQTIERVEFIDDPAPAIRTPEQIAAEEQRQAQSRRYQAELLDRQQRAAELQREAETRAERLLTSLLTNTQREELIATGQFHLTVDGGGQPARHYRIKRGTHGNIKRVDRPNAEGKIVESWCVQPNGVPTPDAMASQVLHLRHDEAGLRKLANIRRQA